MNMDAVQDSSLSERRISPEKPSLEHGNGYVSGNGCSELETGKCEMDKNAHIGLEETGFRKSNSNIDENLKGLDNSTNGSDFESFRLQNIKYFTESANTEPLDQKQDEGDENGDNRDTEIGAPNLAGVEKYTHISVSPCENMATIPAFASFRSESNEASIRLDSQQSEPTQEGASKTNGESVIDKRTPVQSRKRKSALAAPVSARVLRSRSQEKSKDSEPKDVVVDAGVTEANRRKMRKKKQRRKVPVNEFSRIRAHLRYLLHRIKYEQNLIDAYSGEGWKGQSLEKIKPEKELQRAKAHIFRYKLKIRELFRRIDMSLAEGKLPESLFDSDGQIDSEDIFCAKCGSKDLTLDNDIILCDGACERGFHQFCLEPPLLKEDIPADEEGWLCPGCDCKVDCIELLSDFQGSNFSVVDKWEKVFPEEAAAAASGMKMDDYSGLPSDDSDDDDYDPDKAEVDNTVLEEESSSDESNYFSASDDPVTSLNTKQILGLPSDDSEDDEYDPSAADHGEHAKQESSSSDFSSDSEDFGAMFHGIESPREEEGHASPVLAQANPNVGSIGQKFKVNGDKRCSLRDELSVLLESSDAPAFGKRHVERLDYKKLHDETYGHTSSDSSDEDYGETAHPKRRKKSTGKANPVPASDPQRIDNEADAEDDSQKEPIEKIDKKFEAGGSNSASVDPPKISGSGGSGGHSTGKSYQRLGEGVVQRLLESFRENQYPKQDVKESLAKELGLRIQQVSKWFENARWSLRHSSRMDSKMSGSASVNGTSSPQINDKVPEIGKRSNLENTSCNEEKMALPQTINCAEGRGDAVSGKGKSVIDSSLESVRRSTKVDDQKLDQLSSAEKTPKPEASKSQSVRRSSRLQTRSSN